MDRIFHCYFCKKELEFTQLHYLPGQQIYDPLSGINYHTGVSYCADCYQALTTPVKEEKLTEKINLIKDLKPNQTDINLLVSVVKKESEKEVTKDHKKLRLGIFLVKDDSEEIRLTLWNMIIDQVKEGDTLHLENCFVREWEGKKQLTLGKEGRIKKID